MIYMVTSASRHAFWKNFNAPLARRLCWGHGSEPNFGFAARLLEELQRAAGKAALLGARFGTGRMAGK
jgi:hypothetical protein